MRKKITISISIDQDVYDGLRSAVAFGVPGVWFASHFASIAVGTVQVGGHIDAQLRQWASYGGANGCSDAHVIRIYVSTYLRIYVFKSLN